MNYKVLYRKYRPDDFDSIVGQEYIIKILRNSIIKNTISHAYIFSGPRGTGKTSTAKVFAKAINCMNNIDGSPCGKCEFCKNFVDNPDIIEIDAASNNGVDQIRELIDNVKLTPSNGKYKVYIIDEVHMLTTSAFNALLLTLEEPPSHVVFILATTNIESVPITILSRCQRFDFQKISKETISNHLKDISKREKIKIDDDALNEIAYLSDGGMRDALSLLDQLSKNNEKITYDLIENQFKSVSNKYINDLLNYVEKNDVNNIIDSVEKLKSKAVDYKNLIKKLIDALFVKAINIKKTGKIDRLSYENYKNLIEELSQTILKVNINIDSFIILEMILLNYCNVENKEKIYKIETISNKELVKEEIKKDNISKEEYINIRVNNCFVNASKQSLENTKELIEKKLNSKTVSGKIKSILTDSDVVCSSEDYSIFTVENEHSVNSFNEIHEDIEKIFGTKSKHKVVFISEERWNKEKLDYINNLKKGIKYELKDEVDLDNDVIVDNVFDINKVEII